MILNKDELPNGKLCEGELRPVLTALPLYRSHVRCFVCLPYFCGKYLVDSSWLARQTILGIFLCQHERRISEKLPGIAVSASVSSH